jgi:hypothetical protein
VRTTAIAAGILIGIATSSVVLVRQRRMEVAA